MQDQATKEESVLKSASSLTGAVGKETPAEKGRAPGEADSPLLSAQPSRTPRASPLAARCWSPGSGRGRGGAWGWAELGGHRGRSRGSELAPGQRGAGRAALRAPVPKARLMRFFEIPPKKKKKKEKRELEHYILIFGRSAGFLPRRRRLLNNQRRSP